MDLNALFGNAAEPTPPAAPDKNSVEFVPQSFPTEKEAIEPPPDSWSGDYADTVHRRLIRELNAACPADWSPMPDDWKLLDEHEARVEAARERADRQAFEHAIMQYHDAALEFFRAETRAVPVSLGWSEGCGS